MAGHRKIIRNAGRRHFDRGPNDRSVGSSETQAPAGAIVIDASNGHGGPFGCVIVKNGEVVGEAQNKVLSSNDPTSHAELLAVRRASAKLKTFNLSGCERYTNGAPCCMCMSSMLRGRVDRAYYTLSMDDSRLIGPGDDHFYQELARPLTERQIIPIAHEPELADEARAVYGLWFEKPNKVQF